ncbi:glycosyltransferase family 4 protein [Flaviramulus aquimarinus]|uniref:Glycosyltransferase family 4 protein n=1 Tax=Flaviramulus aquimarinus TaxID=1170456 RepID=A0ABP9FBX4_9FLAO
MKLLYIVNQINGTTGQERIIALKSNYFIKHYGYEVTILTLDEVEDTPFFELSEAIKIHNIPKLSNSISHHFSRFKKINEILKAEAPSVVIVCIDNIFGLYLPIFLKKNFQLIYERHNSKRVNYTQNATSIKDKIINIGKKLLLKGGRRYDTLVLLSDDHIKEWKNLKNLTVISNPLIFYPDEHAKLENKKVLAVGRHTHQKGFDMLLKSWKEVVKTYKDWTLEIYGKKDETLSMLSLAKDYGILDYINFHDPVSNIMDVYMESSIYALSSRFEGFPLVLIETMACGVPAVAFNCPCGVQELITHREDGILVNIDDTDSFAKSLINLMENPQKRKKMGHQARESILRLSPDNIFPKWKNLFETLLSK